MPTGFTFIHANFGSLFIEGDDGRFYQPNPEVTLPPWTRVTFQVLNLANAPPGFYFATKVVAENPSLNGSIVNDPVKGNVVRGDDGSEYQPFPKPDPILESGTRVTFQAIEYPEAPPGFSFVKILTVQPKVTPPLSNLTTTSAVTTSTTNVSSKPLGAWSNMPTSIKTPSTVSGGGSATGVKTVTPVTPSLPTPSLVTPRSLSNRQTAEDFQAITNAVSRMSWGTREGYGPSVQVQTKLKWEGEGIELYNRVLEEYQDKRIPGTGLFFYVGTLGVNFGKGGFRISAHTKPKAMIDKSKTYEVLHIEN